MRTCVYATKQQSPELSESSQSRLSSPTPSLSGPFSSLSAGSRASLLGSPLPPYAVSQVGTADGLPSLTDADLYFHFLNHTCKSAPRYHKSRIVLQIGIAKLALDSEPVCHSILALSAACICCDTISTGNADPETVRQLLDVGLQHHTLALEQMRTMTCRQSETDIQPLLACSLLLVPFALAFQHIHHWVLSTKGMLQDTDLLTPRDAILLLRGIRTTIVALNSNQAKSGSPKSETPWDTMFSSQSTDPKDFETIPELSHTMFPMLAATFRQALSQLRSRIESALAATKADENTSSAFDAYDVLNDIMSSTFSDHKTMKSSSECVTYVGLSLYPIPPRKYG